MLPFPAGSYSHQPYPSSSSFPGLSHIPGPAAASAAPPPMDLSISSSTPSSSEAGPSQGKKRSRAPSTSQKGDGDFGSGEGEDKKKKKGKEKAPKKEEEKDEKEKNRTGRACLNCRRQKMKCEGGDNPPCARCKASNSDCIFKPRANAAILIDDAQWQEMVERRLGSLESEMRAGHHRPPSPTRSSSGMSIVHPPSSSSSSHRRLSQSFPDSQQPLPYTAYPQPTPNQSDVKSEIRFVNSPPCSPTFFSTPQTANAMPPPPLPPPRTASPQMTERFRSMADTLGLTLEQLQETRTSIFDGGREVDMTALTFEGVMTCWEFFHTNLLPHLWSFPLPPSPRPSKLLLAAVLAAATLLHPSPQITSLHVQTSHLLDLALSDLVLAPLRPPPPNRDGTSKPSEPGELDDVVGLCVTMTWLVGLEAGGETGGGRRGEVLMGLAWRLAADKCLRGGKVAEEHRKRVWELVQITELFHSSLTLSRPLLPANPPPDLPSLTTLATPPLFQAVAALSRILHGLMSSFASRSFPSVVEMLASRARGARGDSRRDALGYQDEVLVKRFKLEVDEWAKKWLGAIASSNLGTSAFSTIPDPAALNFLVLIYHSSTLLGSIIQRCKADGPTADDDASCLATSRALLQVLNTNVELGSSAGRLPLGLLMFFKLAATFVVEGVSTGKTSRDDLSLVQTLIQSIQLTSPPTSSPPALLLASLLETYTAAQVTQENVIITTPTPTLFSSSSFPQHQQNTGNNDVGSVLSAVQLDQHDFFASLSSPSRMGPGLSGVASPMGFGDLNSLGMGGGGGGGVGAGVADFGAGFDLGGGGGGGTDAFEGDVAFPTYLHTNFSSAPSAVASNDSSWPPSFIPGSGRW